MAATASFSTRITGKSTISVLSKLQPKSGFRATYSQPWSTLNFPCPVGSSAHVYVGGETVVVAAFVGEELGFGVGSVADTF